MWSSSVLLGVCTAQMSLAGASSTLAVQEWVQESSPVCGCSFCPSLCCLQGPSSPTSWRSGRSNTNYLHDTPNGVSSITNTRDNFLPVIFLCCSCYQTVPCGLNSVLPLRIYHPWKGLCTAKEIGLSLGSDPALDGGWELHSLFRLLEDQIFAEHFPTLLV